MYRQSIEVLLMASRCGVLLNALHNVLKINECHVYEINWRELCIELVFVTIFSLPNYFLKFTNIFFNSSSLFLNP